MRGILKVVKVVLVIAAIASTVARFHTFLDVFLLALPGAVLGAVIAHKHQRLGAIIGVVFGLVLAVLALAWLNIDGNW